MKPFDGIFEVQILSTSYEPIFHGIFNDHKKLEECLEKYSDKLVIEVNSTIEPDNMEWFELGTYYSNVVVEEIELNQFNYVSW